MDTQCVVFGGCKYGGLIQQSVVGREAYYPPCKTTVVVKPQEMQKPSLERSGQEPGCSTSMMMMMVNYVGLCKGMLMLEQTVLYPVLFVINILVSPIIYKVP